MTTCVYTNMENGFGNCIMAIYIGLYVVDNLSHKLGKKVEYKCMLKTYETHELINVIGLPNQLLEFGKIFDKITFVTERPEYYDYMVVNRIDNTIINDTKSILLERIDEQFIDSLLIHENKNIYLRVCNYGVPDFPLFTDIRQHFVPSDCVLNYINNKYKNIGMCIHIRIKQIGDIFPVDILPVSYWCNAIQQINYRGKISLLCGLSEFNNDLEPYVNDILSWSKDNGYNIELIRGEPAYIDALIMYRSTILLGKIGSTFCSSMCYISPHIKHLFLL